MSDNRTLDIESEVDRAVSARKVIRDYLLENAGENADEVRAMLGGYGEEAYDKTEIGRIMEAEAASFLSEFMRRAMSKEGTSGVSSALTLAVRGLPPDKMHSLFDKLGGEGSDVCKAFRHSLFAFEDVATLDVDTPVGVSGVWDLPTLIEDFTATKGCYCAEDVA